MIKLTLEDIGTHIIRVYPNIGDLKNTVQIKQMWWFDNKEITVEEYWALLKEGRRPMHIKKFFSYAMIDDVFGLFQFGKQIKDILDCCLKGQYYISSEGRIYKNIPMYLDNDIDAIEVSYKEVTFTPINPYDLQSNVAIKFEVKNINGFADYCNFEIIHDDKYVVYRPVIDKPEDISNFLTSNLEIPPNDLLHELLN